MSNRLGVPQAILDNVIFCHQEEANWPLSEPSVLKRKFDEIFSATRYTKALDTIKQIRKNQTTEVKIQAKELEHLKEKREKELRSARKKVESYQGAISSLEAEEACLQEQIDELVQIITKYNALQSEISQVEHQIRTTKRSRDELASNVQRMKGKHIVFVCCESEDELQELQRAHESNVSGYEDKRRELDHACEELRNKLDCHNDALTEVKAEQGVLKADLRRYELKCQECRELTSQVAQELGISAASGDAEGYLAELERLQKDIEKDIESAKESARKREQDLHRHAHELSSLVATYQESMRVYQEQLAAKKALIKQLESESQPLNTSSQELIDELGQNLKAEESNLEQVQLSLEAENTQELVDERQTAIQENEAMINKLNSDMSLLNKSAGSRAKLALRKAELEKTTSKRDSLKKAMLLEANFFLGGFSDDEIEGSVDSLLSERRALLTELEDNIAKNDKQRQGHDARIAMIRQTLKQYHSEIQAKTRQIKHVCDPEEFMSSVVNAKEELQHLSEEIGFFKSAKDMYQTYIDVSERQKSCPLCKRGFEVEEELVKFIENLRIDYKQAPIELIRVQQQMEAVKSRYNTLQSLQQLHQDIQRLKTSTIPDLEEQASELESELFDLAAEHSELCEGAKDARMLLKRLETLRDNVREWLAVSDEASELVREVAEIEEELAHTGSLMSIDDCQAKLEALHNKNRTIRQEIDKLNNEHHQRQKEWVALESRVRDIKDTISREQQRWIDKQRINERISALHEETTELTGKIEALKTKLEKAKPELADVQAQIDEARADADARQSALQNQMRQIERYASELRSAAAEIRQLNHKDLARDLEINQARQAEVQAEIEAVARELESTHRQWQNVDRKITSMKEYERALADNIKLHVYSREIKGLKAEADRLYAQLYEIESEMGTRDGSDGTNYQSGEGKGSKADSASIYGDCIQRLKQQHSDVISRKAGLFGEVKQIESQVQRYVDELNNEYNNVDALYREQMIVHKTSEIANTDLDKYSKALDNAIMEYHSIKMEEVNKIIRELWFRTYRGTDIETIEIRSQKDGNKSIRSYNYRVVMIKNGHAIDMRGRCSAGQKVLTSLIIRLALAEAFGTNCGILALDEPTTNLDRANIKSFAENLIKHVSEAPLQPRRT
ncbi:DNA repair protein rad50 [Spiromyces aspiralis]|uniref:DNA repair protein rad50 n=1 Tax=Spiromyces aspiralis TaxID=68401 RepID=A0ACC1HUA2_9FUNG|nr:DNA repair protein rad50 [Spiromyces aspiralis]